MYATVNSCHCLIIVPYVFTTLTFYSALPLSNSHFHLTRSHRCMYNSQFRFAIFLYTIRYAHISILFSIFFFSSLRLLLFYYYCCCCVATLLRVFLFRFASTRWTTVIARNSYAHRNDHTKTICFILARENYFRFVSSHDEKIVLFFLFFSFRHFKKYKCFTEKKTQCVKKKIDFIVLCLLIEFCSVLIVVTVHCVLNEIMK